MSGVQEADGLVLVSREALEGLIGRMEAEATLVRLFRYAQAHDRTDDLWVTNDAHKHHDALTAYSAELRALATPAPTGAGGEESQPVAYSTLLLARRLEAEAEMIDGKDIAVRALLAGDWSILRRYRPADALALQWAAALEQVTALQPGRTP